jgi:glycosyltransferase involved in cell wall biosynthesis
MLRVLHVINQVGGAGGAEVSLRALLGAPSPGVAHGLCVLRGPEADLAPFLAAGVRCFTSAAGRPSRVEHVRHVRRCIDGFRPDLVHTTLFDADLAGRLAARMQGVPSLTSVVNTSYEPVVGQVEPVQRWKLHAVRTVDRALAGLATSGFHAISETTAAHVQAHLRVPARRIRVVPRGRDSGAMGQRTDDRREAVRRAMDWGDRPVVLNVARQEPQKGQRHLLEAFAELRASLPDALLVVAGREGRSSSELRCLASRLELTSSVRWLGVRDDVPDLLAAADVFAFPSLYEGLGGAALEAMAIGTPIVASDVPALRELLGEERGWLVPPARSEPLAARLVSVLAGGLEVERRSLLGREHFEQRYELRVAVEGMLRLYRDIEQQLQEQPRGRLRLERFELAPSGAGVTA